ncbi:MAG: TetR/AcrR family transcriptional regulator [Nocardioidaceae bacterium]|nr:TetR/AcrR family transcriptional regulator [Nocardioidaceae bacterium]NUS50399.1 TetR/AcrR family transcriptional regulator [Nocardioidaceae bacterium]
MRARLANVNQSRYPGPVGTRREQILDTAAELFAERGFHGVSVVELGAACGISGPALYKHFPSKDAVLAEMLVDISEELLSVGRERSSGAADAVAALRALVCWHVDFALRHKPLIVVQDRDWANLPDTARERVRTLQRRYVAIWADRLREVHPDLTARTARAMAHATFGLINSTPHSAMLAEPEMRALLTAMAERSLALPPDG